MTSYCRRCNRYFGSNRSLVQHIENSSRHNECPECVFDSKSWDGLLEHCEETRCRVVCRGCDDGIGMHFPIDGDQYWQHVQDENVCTKCNGGRHFQSQSNLAQHQLTHRANNIECFACEQTFKTYGGMFIHLEYGTCCNYDYIELNQMAAECRMWPHYLDEDYREDMLDCIDLLQDYQDMVYPYKCPTCGKWFPKLSSLFQHVESSACDQSLQEGAIRRLRNYIKSRY